MNSSNVCSLVSSADPPCPARKSATTYAIWKRAFAATMRRSLSMAATWEMRWNPWARTRQGCVDVVNVTQVRTSRFLPAKDPIPATRGVRSVYNSRGSITHAVTEARARDPNFRVTLTLPRRDQIGVYRNFFRGRCTRGSRFLAKIVVKNREQKRRFQLFTTVCQVSGTVVRKPSSKWMGAGNGIRTRDFNFGKCERASVCVRLGRHHEFNSRTCVRPGFRLSPAVSVPHWSPDWSSDVAEPV